MEDEPVLGTEIGLSVLDTPHPLDLPAFGAEIGLKVYDGPSIGRVGLEAGIYVTDALNAAAPTGRLLRIPKGGPGGPVTWEEP